jgi:hypothetical protein
MGLTIHILITNLPVWFTELLTLTKPSSGVAELLEPNLKKGLAVESGSLFASTPMGDEILACLITPTRALSVAVGSMSMVPVAFWNATVSCVAMLANVLVNLRIGVAVACRVASAVMFWVMFLVRSAEMTAVDVEENVFVLSVIFVATAVIANWPLACI